MHDLDPVAGCILGRDHGHRRASPARKTDHLAAIGHARTIEVSRQLGRHADPHPPQLVFLEVGFDIDIGQRDNRHDNLAGIEPLPDLDLKLADDTVDGRADFGAVEIELCRVAPRHRGKYGGIGILAQPAYQRGVRGKLALCRAPRRTGLIDRAARCIECSEGGGKSLARLGEFLARNRPASGDVFSALQVDPGLVMLGLRRAIACLGLGKACA